MNLAYFHTLLSDIKRDTESSNIVALFSQLIDQLKAQVGDPANAAHQTSVGTTRQALEAALRQSTVNAYPESSKEALREFSLGWLVPADLLDKVAEAFSGNQITPQLAFTSLKNTFTNLSQGLAAVTAVLDGFGKLKVETDDLGVGGTEILVSIPRQFVDEDPIKLGEEFKKLDLILRPFTELATGEYLPIKVSRISSSEFLIALLILSNVDRAAKVVKAVADAVRSLIGVYKDVAEVRVMKARLLEMDGDGTKKPVAELEKFVEKRVNAGIGKIADELVSRYYKKNDEGRKAEVLAHTKISLKKIAARIDQGFDFETRAGELPPPEMEAAADGTEAETASSIETRSSLQEISEAHREQLSFIREGSPILGLPSPDEEGPAEA